MVSTIALPPLDLEVSWSAAIPAQVTRSGWTGRSKAIDLPGAETRSATIEFEPCATELEERPLRAFVAAMNGVVNQAYIPRACQYHIGDRPLVGSGAGAGRMLPLTGLVPLTRVLEAGQFLTVPLPSGHHRMVMLLADLISSAGGTATAQLDFALNETPVTGTVVETANPFCPMRFVERENPIETAEGVSTFIARMVEAV